jgi:hypothetical protein
MKINVKEKIAIIGTAIGKVFSSIGIKLLKIGSVLIFILKDLAPYLKWLFFYCFWCAIGVFGGCFIWYAFPALRGMAFAFCWLEAYWVGRALSHRGMIDKIGVSK